MHIGVSLYVRISRIHPRSSDQSLQSLHRIFRSEPPFKTAPAANRTFSKTPTTMVEGHQCHRVAHFHRQRLLKKAFIASSPNGRFADGAAAINDKVLARIEVHGKNLFYFFGGEDGGSPVQILHFHFGMSGAFSLRAVGEDGKLPAPKSTTRLQLLNPEVGVAHLSAMTVQHGDYNFYLAKAAALGEDPLREDANPEAVWAKISASAKPIGLLLMDQSVIAGVGNIYRAEILFKSGVHPEQLGRSLSRAAFDEVWRHSVELLRRGFECGSILTVDEEEAKVLGEPWTRRYCYNQDTCGRCHGAIKTWDMATRKVYCCETCQPLVATASAAVAAGRRKAMGAAVQAVPFLSHCAPDDLSSAGGQLSKLTVAVLKVRAAAAGLAVNGKKAELVVRLQLHAATLEKKEDEDEEEEPAAVPTPLPKAAGRAEKRKRVATAKEAVEEKARAGEGRGVEHVALFMEEEDE